MTDGQASVVVPCRDLNANVEYFTSLGFRIDRISPADNPREFDLSGHGLALLLRRSGEDWSGTLRLPADSTDFGGRPEELVAPGGAKIELSSPSTSYELPPIEQSLVVSRIADSADFAPGRAGMGYRDLIPGRLGGRFIASHIRIAEGGEVPDYAHFHKIRFQMIFCYKGWVRVVYEAQGDPFVLEAGDCVIQPPEIRHRVLESSAGLEVVEIGCPAEHDTYADHDITLPTGVIDSERDFGGQQFTRHIAAEAEWAPWRLDGWECRDLGIGQASHGLAGARVARSTDAPTSPHQGHGAEFVFLFVLNGDVRVTVGDLNTSLTSGDCIVVPEGLQHSFEAVSPSSLLEVSLPAAVV